MKSIWRRQGNVAIPVGQESLDALHCFADGKDFLAETRGARNLNQLRLFWALCTILADNDPKISTKEIAKENILWALNYVEIWLDRSEKAHVKTQSIAFERMTQEVFNPFFQRAVDLIATWLDTAPAEIRRQVYEMTDPTKGYTVK